MLEPETERPVAVRTRALTRKFGAFTAVDALDLDVHEGEIFGFLGANGAGKTTTIKILCGLLLPTSGTGTVAGFDVLTRSEDIKRSIGYMSQRFSLYDDLSVRENLEFYAGLYGIGSRRLARRLDELVPRLQLAEHLDKLTASIPMGWKQRVALAAATVHDPAIVFLDEPTGGVDPVSRRAFWGLIDELARSGKTVFVTTHYMDEAEYCHRISVMNAGRIIALGSPADLKAQAGLETIQELFLALVRRDERPGAGPQGGTSR